MAALAAKDEELAQGVAALATKDDEEEEEEVTIAVGGKRVFLGTQLTAAAFNAANQWRKRGLARIPTKFGINFTAKLLNQGGSLVHLYTDGTLLVSHGGTEMGQGLHTKVCQVVAQAFGVTIDRVHVEDTASDKVANSAATAASMSTDLYGMAALDACHQILARLAPVYDRRRAAGDSLELAAVAGDAFFNRIDLSAHGFYAVDGARCGCVGDWLPGLHQRWCRGRHPGCGCDGGLRPDGLDCHG